MEFIPHKFQQDAIDRMIASLTHGALLFDPGLGKTSTVLTALQTLKMQALVVAPLEVVYRVWPNEIKKWDHTKKVKYAILHGPDKEQKLRGNYGIYIINPDGLKWLHKTCKRLRIFPFRVLVVDESTDFKSYKSKRFTEYLGPMLPAFERRYILSGTPVTKSYLDLWSQYYILDLGKRLTDNYYHYRSRWFYPADFKQRNWKPFPGSEEAIRELVSDITIRVSGRDHLDLPDIHFNVMKLPMPAKARNAYKEMAKELLVECENGQIVDAANAAVKSNKLQCISNGFLYIPEQNEKRHRKVIGVEDIHEKKLDALQSIVNELNGNPILVGYYFKHDLTMLKRRFPDAPHFGSDVKRSQKVAIEHKWNSGQLPILLAQIHSTARGLNLQESGYNVFYFSLTWNYEDFQQFVQRVARQGQKSNRVIVHVPIMEQSIDELMYERLQERDVQLNEFLDSFIRHLKET